MDHGHAQPDDQQRARPVTRGWRRARCAPRGCGRGRSLRREVAVLELHLAVRHADLREPPGSERGDEADRLALRLQYRGDVLAYFAASITAAAASSTIASVSSAYMGSEMICGITFSATGN